MAHCALNVTEKPSVAKEISRILSNGNSRRRAGPSQYNHVFEFQSELMGQNRNMIVTSVTGHLMETDFGVEYRNWQRVSPLALFDAPIIRKVPDKNKPLEQNLQIEARKASWLVLWLDCDREGENIASEVVQVCLAANPRLQVYRAKFSAITPQDIHQACRTLGQLNEREVDAVDARQEIDLRIGASFTRWHTLHFQKRFGSIDGVSVISYGPCQFPTLGFVVERFIEIELFESTDFWRMVCTVVKDGVKAQLNWQRNRLFDHHVAYICYENCVRDGQATVIDLSDKPRIRYRPKPLTTIEMQKIVSRKLHMTAARCLQVAEELYQAGLVSYPRTETDSYPDTMNLEELVGNQVHSPVWGDYAQNLLAKGLTRPINGQNSDQAHPPIHPTGYDGARVNNMGPDHEKLYEFITRYFLACVSADARGHQTNVTFSMGGELFSCTGLAIAELNWLEVYPYEKWSDSNIPNFLLNESIVPTDLLLTKSHTNPPPLLSEADLLAKMEKNKIGTDATMAEHIAKILNRGYAEKVDAVHFAPTNLGKALVVGYEEMGLQLHKPLLRSEMEHDMQLIGYGTLDKATAVRNCMESMRTSFVAVCERAAILDTVLSSYFMYRLGGDGEVLVDQFSECGMCKGKMRLQKIGDDRALYCAACKVPYTLPNAGDVSALSTMCAVCSFQAVRISGGGQGHYNLCPYCYVIPPCSENVMDVEQMGVSTFTCGQCSAACPLADRIPTTPIMACPACGSGHYVLKRSGVGIVVSCDRYPQCPSKIALPTPTLSAVPSQTQCRGCSERVGSPVTMLNLRFDTTNVPPWFHGEVIACLGCNVELKELIQEMGPRPGGGRGGGVSYGGGRGVGGPSGAGHSGGGGGMGGGGGQDQATTCHCGLQLASRVVNKDGPNRGKRFRCCPKDWGDPSKCKFFEFNDEGGGSDRGGGTTKRKQPTCGYCKQTGHTKRGCASNPDRKRKK